MAVYGKISSAVSEIGHSRLWLSVSDWCDNNMGCLATELMHSLSLKPGEKGVTTAMFLWLSIFFTMFFACFRLPQFNFAVLP